MLSEKIPFHKEYEYEDDDSILVSKLKKILGFCPNNLKLLKKVFIHSFSKKKRNKDYYFYFQRLEFLGDAVLNSIISHFLYEKLPEKKEGELTQVRSKIVCRRNLNEVSRKLTLTDIFLKKENSILSVSDNILGNILEALIGFLYLEVGYKGCKDFVYKKILHSYVDIEKLQKEIFSYKVWIIEWSQKKKFFINFNTFREKKVLNRSEKNQNVITYLSEFTVSQYGIKTKGRGTSKKRSEEIAAKKAYFLIQEKCKNKKKTE
ncbi:ribonuclease III family protein [Blattabacterium cuenoti]|uniref:ribonuclease III family protein n=1 Tax=Blattabacterium cuenoti TaxID=1653831 RepID=UPI00163C5713|nr:ribonuclease III domain-containing protein [Blattabacterium cuenoti]